jgi:hypothetical protein
MSDGLLSGGKRTLVVLFVPSVERDGKTPVNQDRWVNEAMKMFGDVYGGATAYPRARGVWRDDERGGALVFDEPVVIHCYTTPKDAGSQAKLKKLGLLPTNGSRGQAGRDRPRDRRSLLCNP